MILSRHIGIFCGVILLLWMGRLGATQPPPVRVGIVAYKDFQEELKQSEKLLSNLSRASGGTLKFQIASGTYGDVVHWMDRGMIDIAVVNAGILAEIWKPENAERGLAGWDYLATQGVDEYNETTFEYHSTCHVGRNSSIKNVADLKRMNEEGRVEFLFVHPESVSGCIAPLHALREVGIVPARDQIKYTYSHTRSYWLLREKLADRERVAFIWYRPQEIWPPNPPRADGFYVGGASRLLVGSPLSFPELERLSIPQDVVLARPGFEHAAKLGALLLAHRNKYGKKCFVHLDDWKARYGVVQKWIRESETTLGVSDPKEVSLDEIGSMLLNYARSHPTPPRLALALSGGGAKCSYQVGAVSAIEEKLAALRKDNKDAGLDIALVVGTSGGAMNSLPIAMGITKTPEGRADFRGVWTELDQRDMIRPSALVRKNMGLWFAFLGAAAIVWIVRRTTDGAALQARRVSTWCFLLGILQIALGWWFRIPWDWFGMNHALHHAWMWAVFGIRGSGWFLIGFAILLRMADRFLFPEHAPPRVAWRAAQWIFAVGLLGLPFAQLVTILFYETTLSDGTGIEHVLAEKYPRMMNAHLVRAGQTPMTVDALGDTERLRTVSRQIMDRKLLQRDLVLTGSCLSQTGSSLPNDLYFFANGPAASKPVFGTRGVAMAEHPSLLLDVVMGSGSIYPIFPSRRLPDFPAAGASAELVDGGFAHNSPIEAAILWGATHIVLIEASPEERGHTGNFLENISEAFNHLYSQAQLTDAHSRGRVSIFTLAPSAPHLCVIDFADNLVAASIEKGYAEAGGGTFAQQPHFRKELGEPVFWEVK